MRKLYTVLSTCAFLTFAVPSFAQHQAFNLIGGNYVESPTTTLSLADFTIEFWAYVDATAIDGSPHQFISVGDKNGAGFYIGYDATGMMLAGDFMLQNLIFTNVQMPTNRWTHIAMSVNSSTFQATLYLNGTVVSNNNWYVTYNAGEKFRIGAQVTLTTDPQFAKAKIDDLKSFSFLRSPFTIRRDMFTDPDPADPTLSAWYKMNDNGTHILDNSSTDPLNAGNTGTIFGDGDPNTADPVPANYWTWSPITTASNALLFDGTAKSQVIIPDIPAYDNILNTTTAGGTIEFNFNATTLPTAPSFSTILNKFGQYGIMMNTTQIAIDNGSPTPLVYTLQPGDLPNNVVPTGEWHQMAFVNDATNSVTHIYYDGMFFADIPGAMGTPQAGNLPMTLGITKDPVNGDIQPFNGAIDEVRFWSSQLDALTIFNNYDKTLSGTESNLISQFTFDQGVSQSDNTGMITAFDNVAANNGTLQNFALTTGSASNFVTHTLTVIPVPLPVTLTKFNALRNGVQAYLQWQTAQEENSREFVIERSGDGKTYTPIGTVPAAGKSSQPTDYTFTDLTPINGPNYYRLRETDLDSKYTYSIVRVLNFGESSRVTWYRTGHLTAQIVYLRGNNESYTLCDISGHILRQGQLSSGKAEVSNLPAGVYVVRVVTRTGDALTTKLFLY